MEDVVNLLNQKLNLESENAGLKKVIETLNAEKHALDQTLVEVLKANINLKSGTYLLENTVNKLSAELESKNKEIKDLDHSLKLLDSALESSSSANINCS
jgi:hypothetical protein